MIVVESAGITDLGLKRKGNEDSMFLDDQMKLYVVADGMGGHQAGEVASSLVVETIKDYMSQYHSGVDYPEPAEIDSSLSKSANRLISSVKLSNRVVYQVSLKKTSYRGMGSTVSAVYFTDDTIISCNVGDSPIYLIRDKEIEVLSVPHTVLAEHIAKNPEAASRIGKEYSHMLTRAMGIEDTVKADICEIECFKDDIVVIASDGLTDKVSPEEIRDVVTQKRPDKSCRHLVDLANERGGDDNITVIVLKVKSVDRNPGGIIRHMLRRIKRLFRKS